MRHFKLLVFVLIISNNLLTAQDCNLPTELPATMEDLEEANFQIASCFAPQIHQLATNFTTNAAGGFADLIAAVDYDGGNNWENLT